MKANQQVNPTINVADSTVTFEFSHGLQPLVFHLDRVHPDNQRYAALAGFAQVRLVDRAAVPAADKEGNLIPVKDRVALKRERIAALIQHYESGASGWSIGRVAKAAPVDTILLAALRELYPAKSEADIRVWMQGIGPDAQKQLAASAQVKPTYERLTKKAIGDTKAVEEQLAAFMSK